MVQQQKPRWCVRKERTQLNPRGFQKFTPSDSVHWKKQFCPSPTCKENFRKAHRTSIRLFWAWRRGSDYRRRWPIHPNTTASEVVARNDVNPFPFGNAGLTPSTSPCTKPHSRFMLCTGQATPSTPFPAKHPQKAYRLWLTPSFKSSGLQSLCCQCYWWTKELSLYWWPSATPIYSRLPARKATTQTK